MNNLQEGIANQERTLAAARQNRDAAATARARQQEREQITLQQLGLLSFDSLSQSNYTALMNQIAQAA